MKKIHKSTTHQELFFHILETRAEYVACTIFFRQEKSFETKTGKIWYSSIALCHETDQFCRKTGRNIARRRYFKKGLRLGIDIFKYYKNKPTYEDAKNLYFNLVDKKHENI